MSGNLPGKGTYENQPDVTSRRRLLQALGSAGVIGVAGCTGGDDGGTPTDVEGGQGEDGTGTPTSGETLQDSIVISLGYDPHITEKDWWDVYGGVMPYHTNILEPLTWASEGLRPEPWLAESWERTGDRTWEFMLRDGVTFHNGDPVTADKVVYSFEKLIDELSYMQNWLNLADDAVKKIGNLTVEFTNSEPFPVFPGWIAHNMVAVQHPDTSAGDSKVIGTGPFQLVDVEEDQTVTVRKFDDYWRDEELNVSEITYRVIEDANTRSLALTGHEIDVAFHPPRSKVSSLRDSEKTTVRTQPKPEGVFAGINIYNPPTDDVQLRRALNYVVDQELLVETVMENIGQPAKGPIAPMIYWSAHDELPGYGPNRKKAKQLVEESSYDGEELIFLVKSDAVEGVNIAETLQQWFQQIGVTTNIQVLEFGTRHDRWSTGKAHLNLFERSTHSAAADYILYQMFYSKDPSQNATMYQKEGTGIMNPGEEVDQLIEEGLETDDKTEKTEKYVKVQEILMDQAVVIPLFYSEYIVGAYKDVTNLKPHPIPQMTRWTSMKHREL